MTRRPPLKMDATTITAAVLISPFLLGGLAVVVILNAMIVHAAITAIRWAWS